MPTKATNSNTKRAFSAPFQRWLKENNAGDKHLVSAGISIDSLRNIRMDRCTDEFLFRFQSVLEKVTGLSVEAIFVGAIKKELWGAQDKFPGITTRAELVSELRKATKNRLNEVKNMLRFDGAPSHFERDI